MRLGGQRRSSNIEDRRGAGGGGGGFRGGLPISTRGMSIQTLFIIGLILAGIYFFAPASIKNAVFGSLSGGSGGSASQQVAAGACPANDTACDFVSGVLGSTEDFWATQFSEGRMPTYGGAVSSYQQPRLVLFTDSVATDGCGSAPSSAGPFYCPADNKLYIDLSFYDVMATRLNAPGDFAQAYVIAHEVAHHVQHLIGATNAGPNESQNQHSVRVELQADCLAGVWGHSARADLAIDEADLREALNAAHQIGDDTLQRGSGGYSNPSSYTHGTSAQRVAWFRRGFDSGDARQCDTFNQPYNRL